MYPRFRALVAWTLLAQVTLVGGLGSGLHDLLGCQHGCNASCAGSCTVARAASDCSDCAFCRHAERRTQTSDTDRSTDDHAVAAAAPSGCDGCAVCDLLAQYHCVTPFEPALASTELVAGEAPVIRGDAVVASADRLVLSRGPPAA